MVHYMESCQTLPSNTVIEWLMAECSTVVTRHCEVTAMYLHTYVRTYVQYVACDQLFTLFHYLSQRHHTCP